MTQARPSFLTVLEDVGELAQGLRLPPEAITDTGLPVQIVSTGIPQMMVPVRSLAEIQALKAGELDISALGRVCHALGTDCVMVFALETERPEATVHTRLFAPLLGIPEDPATGSANGALGAYLVHHAPDSPALLQALKPSGPAIHILSEQGAEMGRPSTLYIEVDQQGTELTSVRVGGQVVLLAEGVVRF